MTTRKGKIARLPDTLREQLNLRLQDGEEAKPILDWLNSLPQTQKILDAHFVGKPVSEQNLSEWRQGGYHEWHLRHELLEHAAQISANAQEIETTASNLVDNLAVVLAARYAALFAQWNSELQPDLADQARILSRLTHDLTRLQRFFHRAAKQKAEVAEAEAKEEEKNREESRQESLAVFLQPRETALMAAAFGGGEENLRLAQIVYAIKNDMSMPEWYLRGLNVPALTAKLDAEAKLFASFAQKPAESNQIKPETPQPQKPAEPNSTQPISADDDDESLNDDDDLHIE